MRLVADFAYAFMLAMASVPACGQSVMFAELDGAVVDVSVSYQNVAYWNGRKVSTQSTSNRTIIIGPGDTGRVTWTMTSRGSRRTSTTAPATYSFTLGRAREVASMGGGHGVWLFDDGVLTTLRTYQVGGYKMSIRFSREGTGFACSVDESHAREIGAGRIRRESAFGGDWEIISAKQISSSCSVRKD
jgi:hypothetical protein